LKTAKSPLPHLLEDDEVASEIDLISVDLKRSLGANTVKKMKPSNIILKEEEITKNWMISFKKN
jgi:hypothetical protein